MTHRIVPVFSPIIRRLGSSVGLTSPSIKYSNDYIYRVIEGLYKTTDGKYKIKKQHGR